ncbi:hypothetical protein ACE6H2_010564 [Prunus campanulata]
MQKWVGSGFFSYQEQSWVRCSQSRVVEKLKYLLMLLLMLAVKIEAKLSLYLGFLRPPSLAENERASLLHKISQTQKLKLKKAQTFGKIKPSCRRFAQGNKNKRQSNGLSSENGRLNKSIEGGLLTKKLHACGPGADPIGPLAIDEVIGALDTGGAAAMLLDGVSPTSGAAAMLLVGALVPQIATYPGLKKVMDGVGAVKLKGNLRLLICSTATLNTPITYIFLSFFFVFFSSSSAFNITEVLNKYPDFSIFNDYLTRTQVSRQINEHRVVTILAVNNAAMSSLVGKSMDIINKVMRIHVYLDYYTLNKLKGLPSSQPSQVTTLLESPDQQRYLNITNVGTVSIISGAGSEKVGVLRDIYPDDIYKTSIVEVTNVIMPSSLLTTLPSSPSPSPPSSVPPSPPSSVPSPPSSVPSSSTFNITNILFDYPDFTTFNTYLTDTQVCDQINAGSSVTVLAVNNAAMSSLVGKSADIKKKVLSLHVITGCYTLNKFRSLPNSQTTQLNTMLQASFQSVGFQGLLNVTNGDTVSLVYASGSEKAQLVKDIYTDDFKISVVKISSLIVPSDSPTSPPSSPSASPPSASTSSPPSSTPSSSSPFDITKTLTGSPDFNLFSTYLTQTQVANQINERKTMTIFVVNNGAMTYLVDKPMEIKKKVLSLHVIMDYYTVQKFHNLPVSQPARINTLLQVTDQPSAQQGFVNVTNGDTISIVSAAVSDQAVVVRDIAADESSYISVVQISNLILPSSLTAPTPSPSSNPGKLRSAAPVKAPTSSIAAAPKVGDTTSSSIAAASVSNAPMTSIASGPIGAAPALHASAVSSIDCASIVFEFPRPKPHLGIAKWKEKPEVVKAIYVKPIIR